MRALRDEQSRLTSWKHELEVTEDTVKTSVEAMDRQRRQLNADRQKLDQLAQQVRDKSAEINDLVAVRCSTFELLEWSKVSYINPFTASCSIVLLYEGFSVTLVSPTIFNF